MAKSRMSIWPKSADFLVHFRPTSSIFGLLVMKKKLKSFALIAKHIQKKDPKKLVIFQKKLTEMNFFEPQNGQITGVNMAKSADFWVHFRSTNFIFGLFVPKKILKSFPLIAKNI